MLNQKQIAKSGMMVAFLVVCAFIRIPVFAVPYSLVFFAVNFITVISDIKTGFFSILIYVLLGLLGVPVFSQGGGLSCVISPGFGYIIGFVVIQPVCAFLKKVISDYKPGIMYKNIILGIVNLLVVYFLGCGYGYVISCFYLKQNLSLWYFVQFYILIFIPGDIISVIISGYLIKKLKFVI